MRGMRLYFVLALALLAAVAGGGALFPALPAQAQDAETDYDADDDNLIEITTLAQLDAMRWDLNGDVTEEDPADRLSYALAFPNAPNGMGCAGTCKGYEQMADLNFDTDGDGSTVTYDSAAGNAHAGYRADLGA